jgi:acyl-CoA reductase-like NAD-dependent aldehyde dehydrogenase
MQTFSSHYIDDQWVAAQLTKTFKVFDSNTEEVMVAVPIAAGLRSRMVALSRCQHAIWRLQTVRHRTGNGTFGLDKFLEYKPMQIKPA